MTARLTHFSLRSRVTWVVYSRQESQLHVGYGHCLEWLCLTDVFDVKHLNVKHLNIILFLFFTALETGSREAFTTDTSHGYTRLMDTVQHDCVWLTHSLLRNRVTWVFTTRNTVVRGLWTLSRMTVFHSSVSPLGTVKGHVNFSSSVFLQQKTIKVLRDLWTL